MLVQVVRLLLGAGCRVNALDVAGHSAVFHASGASSDEMCHAALRLMCAGGGDVNVQNRLEASLPKITRWRFLSCLFRTEHDSDPHHGDAG